MAGHLENVGLLVFWKEFPNWFVILSIFWGLGLGLGEGRATGMRGKGNVSVFDDNDVKTKTYGMA
jgi:hypothetical protein